MNVETHCETVFSTKAPDTVSWYRPHLELSLDLIERCAPGRSASIIDVGAGESTLVDDLVSRGYQELTVLDVSKTAIEALFEAICMFPLKPEGSWAILSLRTLGNSYGKLFTGCGPRYFGCPHFEDAQLGRAARLRYLPSHPASNRRSAPGGGGRALPRSLSNGSQR